MKAWIEKPVSSPNDVEGNYFVITRNGLFDIISYSHDFGWGCSPGYFTHYLVPAEGNFYTHAELEQRDRLMLNAFINSIRKETGASQGLIMIAIQDNKFLLDREPVISWLKSNAPKF